ncbi:MAG: hypothetical protein HUJ61_01405 [Bacilli bacterium]|nr:hypothetical protein [Bacilli bacterium]
MKKIIKIVFASLMATLFLYLGITTIISIVTKQYITGGFFTLPMLICILVISILLCSLSVLLIIRFAKRK